MHDFCQVPAWLSSILTLLVGLGAVWITAGRIGRLIVSNYKEAADSAQTLADSLRERIASLEETNRNILREQGGLRKENEFLRNRNVELQREIDGLRQENEKLLVRLSELETLRRKRVVN